MTSTRLLAGVVVCFEAIAEVRAISPVSASEGIAEGYMSDQHHEICLSNKQRLTPGIETDHFIAPAAIDGTVSTEYRVTHGYMRAGVPVFRDTQQLFDGGFFITE